MAETAARAVFQPDSDVHIAFEDQQKINLFARQNAKSDDFKADIKSKQNELKNLEDAAEELFLLDDDEDHKVPFHSGEIFLYMTVSETQAALEKAKEKVQAEIKTMQNALDDLKSSMGNLKAQLYGKFGTHINLECEDE